MKLLELNQEDINKIIKKAQIGHKESLDFLVTENIGLVRSIVKRFTNRGCEYEDLIQIGSIGLLKAIKKFDMSYNVKFSTYAVPLIVGEIKRFLRDDGIIKVSRKFKDIAIKAYASREYLRNALGRDPTVTELAKELGISKEDLLLAINSQNPILSLNELINPEDGSPIKLMDKIKSEESQELNVVNSIIIKEILSTLEQRERQIIILRYFKELTQCQVARLLGISQVQVSRIEKKVLNKLKNKII